MTGLCARLERLREFRALNMAAAHVQDLLARGVIREVETQVYELR